MSYYTQLSLAERVQIFEYKKTSWGVRKIARALGRDKSCISRELKRNSNNMGYYLYPIDAQARTNRRKARHGTKVQRNLRMSKYIQEKLDEYWSPDAIAGKWSQENPDESISTEAIYSYIYSKQTKHLELWKKLPHKKKKRGIARKKRDVSAIPNRVSIDQRPAYIEHRLETGHFESDLFFNEGSMSENVLNIIDRKSRFTILKKNESKKSNPIINKIAESVGSIAKTITFDNGKEFAEHKKLGEKHGINTFFCDAGCPWQKGSVEHSNKLYRRFLPFKMQAGTITQEMLNWAAHIMNNIPRKSLNYRTPLEVFKQDYPALFNRESRVKIARPAIEAIKNVGFNQKYLNVALHN
jgi:IS30 family transposase